MRLRNESCVLLRSAPDVFMSHVNYMFSASEFQLKAAGQTDSQVHPSQRKFAKPELAYGLPMGGQTDSQVGSQVQANRKNRKFYAYTNDLRSTCVDLRTCVRIWVRSK